jgi:hypothetical protein
MEKRYGVEVTGTCRICGFEGKTEIHHIISQSKIAKINRPELLTNPGNLVELCLECHDLTDSSIFYRLHESKSQELEEMKPNKRRQRQVYYSKKRKPLLEERKKKHGQCQGKVASRSGRRCQNACEPGEVTCKTHRHQRVSIEIQSNAKVKK